MIGSFLRDGCLSGEIESNNLIYRALLTSFCSEHRSGSGNTSRLRLQHGTANMARWSADKYEFEHCQRVSEAAAHLAVLSCVVALTSHGRLTGRISHTETKIDYSR